MRDLKEVEDILHKLTSKYPSLDVLNGRLAEAIRARARLPMSEFFEPVSVIDKSEENDKGKTEGQLVTLSAQLVDSWRHHVALGQGVKMSALEDAIFRELISGSLLTASVLARSHMEAAGFIALCQKQLLSCAKNRDFSPLKKLIPKYFAGVAPLKDPKLKDGMQGLEFMFEAPKNTMDGIDALDAFSENEQIRQQRVFRWRYAYLCEYAHPLVGGLKDFRSSKEIAGDGWTIRYSFAENSHPSSCEELLKLVFDNIRAGWANALLLAHSKIFPTEDGLIGYDSAPRLELRWIYENLLSPRRS